MVTTNKPFITIVYPWVLVIKLWLYIWKLLFLLYFMTCYILPCYITNKKKYQKYMGNPCCCTTNLLLPLYISV